MACEMSENVNTIISQEIDDWLNINSDGTLVLLEISGDDVDCCSVNLLLGSEHEVKLHVPKGYPKHEDSFLVESEAVIQTWTIAINEYLLDSKDRLRLADVLDKAVELFSDRKKKKESSSEEEEIDEDEEEPANNSLDLDDDDTFTTAWDLKVARKKMRWSKKEPLYREIMKRRKLEQGYEVNNKTNQQIFTSNAASGILTNDLIKIMECEETCGFSAEPIDDNIYHWRVRLRKFDPKSDLAHDLEEIMRRHGYNYIEMEMMFEIDLFPFYPPLVKVLRPRLQGCMMQRITNIEFLQLSYWSPTKDMKSVIEGIQDFMQRWAQIDVEHDRNDLSRLPYLDIEHYLLTLAQVSEVSPRANDKYTLDEDKIQELKTQAKVQCNTVKTDKKKDEFWARGVGYGNHNRPDWDVNAYLAAKKEKDNKIESALREILSELKKLPTTVSLTSAQLQADRDCAGTSSVSDTQAGGDYTTDMFTVLEGSALVPFMEVHLKENTFLEISRHSAVYSVIISVIREIAYRRDLLTLLCCLEGQTKSLYQHLEQLNEVASVMLKQITKPANGHVPPDDAGRYDDDDDEYDSDSMDMVGCLGSTLNISRGARQVAHDLMHEHLPSTEEKLAREICVLFKLVKHTLEKEDLLSRCKSEQTSDNGEAAAAGGLSNKQYSLKTCVVTETGYREAMKKLQFQSCSIPVKGKHCHYYANQGAKCPLTTSKNQVVRIAQELSSLSTSLPLNLSSSIFVRTDDEMIPLMQALITGPEGTPYSSGCFLFDVYFPPTYPLTPPKVHLRTTGEGTVRFNPNLYNCGTVCLSLLGTWQGHGGEQWNDKTSTILQVLVSIQSLILVPDPYFNEPGYEQHMNTEEGRKHSEGYNRDIRINCINHAMIGPLQNPPPGFEEVIRSHFYLKKEHILQEVQGWSRSSKCSSLDSAISSLKKELKKLTPHPKA